MCCVGVRVAVSHAGFHFVDKMIRTDQPKLFSRPSCKQDVAFQFELAGTLLMRQVLRHLQHAGDTRGVVVGAKVDHASLILFRQ